MSKGLRWIYDDGTRKGGERGAASSETVSAGFFGGWNWWHCGTVICYNLLQTRA